MKHVIYLITLLSSFSYASVCKEYSKLEILGLNTTQRHVINTELDLPDSSCVMPEEIERAVQRLRNTQIVRNVSWEILGESLIIKLEEKWPLIPILKFGGISGSNFYTLGAYDPNVFGEYIELGGQYENLNGHSSFVAWTRDPQFLGKRNVFVGFDVWNTMRQRVFYDREQNELGGFSLTQQRLNSSLEYELKDSLALTLNVEYLKNTTDESSLPTSLKNKNIANAYLVNSESQHAIASSGFKLGEILIQEERSSGEKLELLYSHAIPLDKASHNWNRLTLTATYFKLLALRSNLALRLSYGVLDSTNFESLFYLGAFESVRGLFDAQIKTKHHSLVNVEYRIPSFQSDTFILQHVIFSDNLLYDLSSNTKSVVAAGAGLRFIFPKIYRFNLRLDYGFAFGDATGSGLSFGLQQFI